MKNKKPADSGLVMRLVRWRVTGYILVPHAVEFEVEAKDEKTALRKAKKIDARKHILSNSGDEASACDFVPWVEEICPPNAKSAGANASGNTP